MTLEFRILIAVALTYTLGALTYYPPISGALCMCLGLGFTLTCLWLSTRNRDESPELRVLRAQVGEMLTAHEALKSQVERMVLSGRR